MHTHTCTHTATGSTRPLDCVDGALCGVFWVGDRPTSHRRRLLASLNCRNQHCNSSDGLVPPDDHTKLICTAALWVNPLAATRSFFVCARKLAQKHTSLPARAVTVVQWFCQFTGEYEMWGDESTCQAAAEGGQLEACRP
jgi:hypothetical protein